MKIAYLFGSLNRGGTETLLLDVFKNASKADFDFIGIHRKVGVLKNDFYDTGQRFFKLTPKFPVDIFYFFKLRKLLKKENVQIVHAQQCLDALYAWIACLGTNIKVVQTFHGYDDLDLNKKNKLAAFTAKRTDKNFFVSQSTRDFYVQKYSLNIAKQAVVYNGISFEKLDKITDFEELEFRKKTDLFLGAVGNFNSVRDQMTVCRFLNLLNKQNADFHFVFVGKKVESEAFLYGDCVNFCKENNLLEKTHFLGTRDDVPAILKQLDAFVYSTDHDTFGIAVIEAIAAGIPVFVNDWEVMTEITNNGKLAVLYKTKDEQDLFEKFMLFLHNRSEYIQKAKENSQIVRDKFSIEKHLQNLKKEYESIC